MDIKQVPHVVIETGGKKIKKSYEQIMERGGNSMFDCGIHQFVTEVSRKVTEKHDAMVVEEVRKVGIDIDKEQLERAILDANSFYEDGYKDGKMLLELVYKKLIALVYSDFDLHDVVSEEDIDLVFSEYIDLPKGE